MFGASPLGVRRAPSVVFDWKRGRAHITQASAADNSDSTKSGDMKRRDVKCFVQSAAVFSTA